MEERVRELTRAAVEPWALVPSSGVSTEARDICLTRMHSRDI